MLLRLLKEKKLANLWIYDPDVEKARQLCREFSLTEERAQPLASLAPMPSAMWGPLNPRGFHLVIDNGSLSERAPRDRPPLGPYPAGSLFAGLATDPPDAGLARTARDGGLLPIDPLRCLIGSAAAGFAMMFLRSPPRKHDDELVEHLRGLAA